MHILLYSIIYMEPESEPEPPVPADSGTGTGGSKNAGFLSTLKSTMGEFRVHTKLAQKQYRWVFGPVIYSDFSVKCFILTTGPS